MKIIKRRTRKPGTLGVLKLAGHSIEVRWVKDLAETQECAGSWQWSKMRIELDSELTEAEAQETLIHECAHAVSDLRGLELTESQVRHLGLDLQQMLTPFLKRVC